MCLQVRGIQQLTRQHGLLGELVGIERRNALLGGTKLLVGQTGFLQAVQIPMPGHQQRGTVTDFQVFGGDGHALRLQLGDFLPQVLGVKGNAVAQNVHHALAENTGGQQVQRKLAILIDDGMTGVAAALIANHNVIVLGQQVHHTALAFIAPVNTNDCTISHNSFTFLL